MVTAATNDRLAERVDTTLHLPDGTRLETSAPRNPSAAPPPPMRDTLWRVMELSVCHTRGCRVGVSLIHVSYRPFQEHDWMGCSLRAARVGCRDASAPLLLSAMGRPGQTPARASSGPYSNLETKLLMRVLQRHECMLVGSVRSVDLYTLSRLN